MHATGPSPAPRRRFDEPLARAYLPSVTAIARGMLLRSGRHDISIDDAVGRTMEQLVRHGVPATGDIGGWVATVTRNTVLRLIERRHPTPSSTALDGGDPSPLGSVLGWQAPDPEDTAVNAARRAWLRGAIGTLDERRRYVLVEVVLKARPGPQVAAELGIGPHRLYELAADAIVRLHRQGVRDGWADPRSVPTARASSAGARPRRGDPDGR